MTHMDSVTVCSVEAAYTFTRHTHMLPRKRSPVSHVSTCYLQLWQEHRWTPHCLRGWLAVKSLYGHAEQHLHFSSRHISTHISTPVPVQVMHCKHSTVYWKCTISMSTMHSYAEWSDMTRTHWRTFWFKYSTNVIHWGWNIAYCMSVA